MNEYEQLINSCGGAFNENDVLIGAELSKSLIEQCGEKVIIDIVVLQRSPKLLDEKLYSDLGTTREEYWKKIKDMEPIHISAFIRAIKSYLFVLYRINS